MQWSLINLQQSERIREGERILRQGLQHNLYCRAEDVGLMANLWQKSAPKVAILSIFIILGGVISVLIVKNLSENSWWIIWGTALGFTLGIVGASAPFYRKEICAVLKKENREVIL